MGYFSQLEGMGGRRNGMYMTNRRQLEAALQGYVGSFDNPANIKLVLRGGAAAVARLARKENYPRSQYDDREYGESYHYAYMGSGTNRRKVRIYKGNLLRSTKYYFTRRNDYEVGPKVLRKSLNAYGKGVNDASGYYASMIFGKAWKYRQYILEPLLEKPQVLEIIKKDFERQHNRLQRRYSL